eukprot:Pgem_evm1s17005
MPCSKGGKITNNATTNADDITITAQMVSIKEKISNNREKRSELLNTYSELQEKAKAQLNANYE